MMSFYECSDFAFNFNLIVKLKSDNLTGDNIKDAVAKQFKAKAWKDAMKASLSFGEKKIRAQLNFLTDLLTHWKKKQ